MSRTSKETSMVRKKKSMALLNNFSITDVENFELPQQSSTPSKIKRITSKRILKDNNSLNISVIKKHDQSKLVDVEVDNQQYKQPILPVIEENYEYNRVPELFCSDPEDESLDTQISVTHNSDDKWMTVSDISEGKSCCTNVSDLLAEIEADVEVRFEKPPRRSYPGRKRTNKSMFEDGEENREIEVKVIKKYKKPKQKKKVDPQEEALIQSINEHFNDVETFSLAVEK